MASERYWENFAFALRLKAPERQAAIQALLEPVTRACVEELLMGLNGLTEDAVWERWKQFRSADAKENERAEQRRVDTAAQILPPALRRFYMG